MVKCACSTEAVEFQYWSWGQDEPPEFYISMWRQGFKRPMCWQERLRWCWRILRSGDPWADDIIVSELQAKQIADFLNQHQSNGKKETIQ